MAKDGETSQTPWEEIEGWLRQVAEERMANDVEQEEREITRQMGFVFCEFGTHWLSNVLGVACPECGAQV